jgi:hypothetical protein
MKGLNKLNYIASWGAFQDSKVLDLTSLKILECLICGSYMSAFKEVTSLMECNSEFYHFYLSL